jgi:hypothetical protein
MRLEVRGIDHQPVGLAAVGRQLGKDAVEHAQAAPADEPVVDRLVRPIGRRRIPPTQAVLQDKDDPGDHPPVINPRNPMRKREKWLNPPHLRLTQQPHVRHR